MLKREADFGVLFRHWLRANPQYTCAYELKQSKDTALPFASLEPNQIAYLSSIASDVGTLIRVLGVSGEPDYVYLRNAPANVVVKFPDEFHIISIGTWLLEKERSIRKSLTNARAREISIMSVKTKKPR